MRDSETRATRWTWRSAKWFILATVALALFIGSFHLSPNPDDSPRIRSIKSNLQLTTLGPSFQKSSSMASSSLCYPTCWRSACIKTPSKPNA